ncbi:MAG: hypothetical protein WED13_04905 [Methyloceanibacter sp.]
MADIAGDAFRDPHNLERLLLRELSEGRQDHAEYIETAIRKQFPGAFDADIRAVTDLIFALAPRYISQHKASWATSLDALGPLMKQAFAVASRKGHVSALAKDHTAAERKLSEFEFSVWALPEHSLVLGDCGPVGFDDRLEETRRVIGGEVAVICLPLSDRRLLVGSKTRSVDVDAHRINEASAAVSAEFFVSSVKRESSRLPELIGSRSDLWSAEDQQAARRDLTA